jgi:hypothetical protein
MTLAAVFIVLGCSTPAPQVQTQEPVHTVEPDARIPLTISIWDRLTRDKADLSREIKNFQFILSGRITLERQRLEQNDSVDNGRANFQNVHIRDVYIFPDQLEGQALTYDESAGELILNVCFEKDNDYTLPFYCAKDNDSGYFYLKVNPDAPKVGEEKGTITYDGDQYKVKYSGGAPYLFIRLSQSDIDKINERTMEGRKVNN